MTTSRAPVLSVKTFSTADEIQGERTLWNWPGTRDSDLDYFLYFARMQSDVLRPLVWVAHRGNTPEAMLIGKIEERRIPMRLGYLNCLTPRVRVLNIVYGGLRGSTTTEATETLVEEVLNALRRGDADISVFERLNVNSQLYRTLGGLPGMFERGFCWEQQNHYRLQLPANSQALHEMLPVKQKRNYQRKGRKLVRDFSGDVSCRWFRQATPAMYRDLEFIAERSYQRSLGVGFKDTPELRGEWELAGSKGWLRVCILYVQGKPCAFFAGAVYGGILWGDYMAYDQQFAPYSPGMYLLLRGFGDLCDNREECGVKEVDFGPGESELKLLLSTSSEQQSSGYLYAPTPKGTALNLIFSLVFLMHRLARDFLVRASLLAKARRLRREHASRKLGL